MTTQPKVTGDEGTSRPDGLLEGTVYRVWFPFLRDTYTEPPTGEQETYVEGETRATWRPGWTYELCGHYGDDSEPAWEGDGEELRELVAICKPGHYPARAFYVRQWRDPDGRVFGKKGLRMTTASAFRRWTLGEPKARILHDIGGAWRRKESEQIFERLLADNARRNAQANHQDGSS